MTSARHCPGTLLTVALSRRWVLCVSIHADKETEAPDQLPELADGRADSPIQPNPHMEPCNTQSLYLLLMTDTSPTSITFHHAFKSERWSQKWKEWRFYVENGFCTFPPSSLFPFYFFFFMVLV